MEMEHLISQLEYTYRLFNPNSENNMRAESIFAT
jgi:hypothetical protein